MATSNESIQERKPVPAVTESEDPSRKRLTEAGLNLKPSGRVHAPTSLEHKAGDRTVGQYAVEDPVFNCRDVNVFYGSKHALRNVNIDVARKQVLAIFDELVDNERTRARVH